MDMQRGIHADIRGDHIANDSGDVKLKDQTPFHL